MTDQTIDDRLQVIFYAPGHTRTHNPSGKETGVVMADFDIMEATEAIKRLVLEAKIAGMLQVQALFEDDPNPDAVRPLSSSQLRKLHEYVKKQLKGGE